MNKLNFVIDGIRSSIKNSETFEFRENVLPRRIYIFDNVASCFGKRTEISLENQFCE